MELTFSKRKWQLTSLALIALLGIGLVALKLSGRVLAQAAGFDSGREAAIYGAQIFYSVDYHTSADRWAARLCPFSTQDTRAYYQITVATFLWPTFIQTQTIVDSKANQPILLSEDKIGEDGTFMQIWQLTMTLSAPWS
jgi:hypothetical protein